jgi:hypothetical protein
LLPVLAAFPEHELRAPQSALALKLREEAPKLQEVLELQVDFHVDWFPFDAVHEQS